MSEQQEGAAAGPRWTDEAKALMDNVPFIVRKAATKGVETYARAKGLTEITAAVVGQAADARERGEVITPQPEAKAAAEKKVRRQYVSFMFYRVDPAWRRLPVSDREHGKKEFQGVVDQYTKDERLMALSYSTVGTRGDCDFMMWRISYSLETLQEFTGKLLATRLGQYLATPFAYLGLTKRSVYVDKLNPEHEEQRLRVVPGKSRFLFVYPFVKTPEWYLLTKHARQGMMDEHIEVGTKYPSVKLNTTYSFGLDDQEFVVAFETDKPEDFLDLVMELRETQGRLYTLRDTPIFTCIRQPLAETLDLLGG